MAERRYPLPHMTLRELRIAEEMLGRVLGDEHASLDWSTQELDAARSVQLQLEALILNIEELELADNEEHG